MQGATGKQTCKCVSCGLSVCFQLRLVCVCKSLQAFRKTAAEQVFLAIPSLESISMDSAAYPFLAFSGIPSLSFKFTSNKVSGGITHLFKTWHIPHASILHPYLPALLNWCCVFLPSRQAYPYMGTIMDNRDKLNKFTSNQVAQLAEKATQFAGHMALRLVHDHLLRLDLAHYDKVIRKSVFMINSKVKDVKSVSVCLFFSLISA